MLPIYDIRGKIDSLPAGGALVITAPTGSGKSTQVPQMLLPRLQAGHRLLVLQPRRLAVRMLAERVADELHEPLGKTVGYQTRYERVFSSETKILFITEGILTRMLISDLELPGVDCIIFDEFHERSLNTDLGLAMAAYTRREFRQDLSIIVMSATIDPRPVCHYLDDCPAVSSNGRLFEVNIRYCSIQLKLEGAPMAAAKTLLAMLQEGGPGDFLIFMPGGYEIRQTMECIQRLCLPEPVEVLPLYGNLPPEAQHKVMEPSVHRKVIIATNIAETSLTIPGVRNVIDSGLARVNRYNSTRGFDVLETQPIAKDSADQRAGRAGREAPGICVRLWTELEQGPRNPRTLPEIQRADLADALLSVVAFGFNNPGDFPWFERPPELTVARNMELLQKLGFLRATGGLTARGEKLHSFPAHPRISLLIYLGATSGCLKEAAMAAALLTERPLQTSGGQAVLKPKHSNQAVSDFFPLFQLLSACHTAHFAPDYCASVNVNPGAAREIWRSYQDYFNLGQRFSAENPSATPQAEFVKCILQAFSDRVAKRCSFNSQLCLLPQGRHAELAKDSLANESRFLVAADLREAAVLSNKSQSKYTLSLASAVEEEWLLDLFPEQWTQQDVAFWDTQTQRVMRKQITSCLDLPIEEKVRPDPDPLEAASILAQQILSGNIPLPECDSLQPWLDRVQWLRPLYPDMELPDFDHEGREQAITNLCFGEYSAKNLKNKNVLEAFQQCLTPQQRQFVEKMAPPFLYLPSGHKLKITYQAGQTPKGRARIQDFYDVKQTPTVAGGAVRLLLDILAPNNRTVQITDDLTNFWLVLYPKIKPELARRYPRHLWK